MRPWLGAHSGENVVGSSHRERLRNHRVICARTASEAEEAVTRLYVPHRLEPSTASSALELQLNAAQLGTITAGYLRYSADVRLLVPETTDFHVDIPLVGHMEARCGSGEPVLATPRRAAVFMPARPADLQWQARCAQLCLMLDRAALQHELEQFLGQPVNVLEFDTVMDLTTPEAQSWLRVVDLLEHEVDRPDGLIQHPLLAARVQNLVMDGLLFAHRHNYSGLLHSPDRPPAPRAVRRVVALIQDRPDDAWSSGQLAQTAGVSVRSLQEGFQRGYGMSPMAYLRAVRLERAHEELSASSPDEVTVSGVAARWGFPHASRFAVAYKRRYHCSPSETLRRSRTPS
jgi:AraC-like DNA-binding protein